MYVQHKGVPQQASDLLASASDEPAIWWSKIFVVHPRLPEGKAVEYGGDELLSHCRWSSSTTDHCQSSGFSLSA